MAEKETTFHFKQFDIAQDRCAMKVGTDGVLLGAWAFGQTENPRSAATVRILDIGCGTGLIAIMLAQRFSADGCRQFHIDAVEIDHDAACQAAENAAATPWSAQIAVHPCSLRDFMADAPADALPYDFIVTNPPFYNATLKPEDAGRATARHKDALPLREIMQCAKSRLSAEGTLSMIYPTDYDGEVMTEAVLAGLSPMRICNVLTKIGKPAKRRMLEIAHKAIGCETLTLALRDADGQYTAEYRKLTEPFYIRLA